MTAREFHEIMSEAQPVELLLPASIAFVILFQLRLALSQPDNHGLPTEITREFIAGVRQQLPAAAQLIIDRDFCFLFDDVVSPSPETFHAG